MLLILTLRKLTFGFVIGLNLYEFAAKVAYCLANYSRMNELIQDIFHNVNLTLDLVQPYSLRIRFYNDKRMYDDALTTGLEILGKLENNIVTDELSVAIASNVQKMKGLLFGKSSDDISMIKANNETVVAIMMIFSNIVTSAFFSDLNLLLFISRK